MKKKVLNGLLFGGIGALTIAATSTTILSACSSNNNDNNKPQTPAQSATIDLYRNYDKAVSDAIGNGTYLIDSSLKDKVLKVMDNYLSQAKNLQEEIDKSGSIDEQIWIDSVIFQIGSERASVDTEAYLLGAEVGGNICTQYNNWVVKNGSRLGSFNTFDGWTNRYNKFTIFTNTIMKNFQEGITKEVTLSGIMLKMLVSDTLQTFYAPQLAQWLQNNQTATGGTINAKDLIKTLGNSTYATDLVTETIGNLNDKITGDQKTQIQNQAKEADKLIDKYTDFLVNTYWNGVKYGWNNGAKPDTFSLRITNTGSTATGEVTNTYPVPTGTTKTIAGLGLTQDDLNTKDIGIGFAPGTYKDGTRRGLKIYQDYLLYKNTTLYNDAKQVNKLGIDNVELIKNNMMGVDIYLAQKLSGVIGQTGNWVPNGYTYDENIFDEKTPVDFKTINGVQTTGLASLKDGKWTVSPEQLKLFFKWLNTEQWFFGRDVLSNQVITLPQEVTGENRNILLNQGYSGNKYTEANGQGSGSPYSFIVKYVNELGSSSVTDKTKNNFGDAGDLYQQYVVNKKGIAPGASNVNGAQAYVGASFSMDSYNRWKESVRDDVKSIFIKSANSSVNAPNKLTLNVNIVTGTGGAAYAGGNTFYLDVNPYYGLQKWSITTLATHESLPGHNLQMIYASENPSSENAPQLSYTSYAEGWGLFSEWLAVQYGSYGQPKDLTAQDWLNADKRMQLPNFDQDDFNNDQKFDTVNIDVKKANEELVNAGNGEFMNGIYETDYNGTSTTDSGKISQGYYNAMQYFGFLNERQLRAMRMALDTSVHAGGLPITKGTITDNNEAWNNVGKAVKNTGWSLQDEIDFMQANSGLGQGDVTRESQRYLNYTGQATSYLSGEIAIEELFGKASAAYETKYNGKPFMDFTNLAATQDNTAPFFNLILRNNDIPLATLQKHVTNYIEKNIGAIPTVKTIK